MFAPYLSLHKKRKRVCDDFFIDLYKRDRLAIHGMDRQRAMMNVDFDMFVNANANSCDNIDYLKIRHKDATFYKFHSYLQLSAYQMMQKKIWQYGENMAPDIPTWIFAAEHDLTVDNNFAKRLMHIWGQEKRFITIEGAYHQMLDYTDERGSQFSFALTKALHEMIGSF